MIQTQTCITCGDTFYRDPRRNGQRYCHNPCQGPTMVRKTARRTNSPTCIHGHVRTPENTYFYSDNRRMCKDCKRAKNREYMSTYDRNTDGAHGHERSRATRAKADADAALKELQEWMNEERKHL